MKKILTLITLFCTVLCLGFVLSACGGGNGESADKCKDGHIAGSYIDQIPPTCEEEGLLVYHCSECNEDYTLPSGQEALGHNLGSATYNDDHTCTKNGTQDAYCYRCTQTVTVEVPNTAKHEWENSIYCKHCNTEEYAPSKNLKFTLNESETGYVVSWSIISADEVLESINSGKVKQNWETIINIPATYNGLPVVEIAEYGFSGEIYNDASDYPEWAEALTNAGVSSDNYWDWNNSLRGLKYIYIPSSVEKIGDYAFYHLFSDACQLTISDGVKYIGESSFDYAGISGAVTLPNSIEHLGERVFQNCKIDSLEYNCSKFGDIPTLAFYGNNIRKLTIPSFVTSVGGLAFNGNPLLTITVESDSFTVYDDAFGYDVNTIINKSNTPYTLDDVREWFKTLPTLPKYFAIRETDPNTSITLKCTVSDNKYNNGVHVGVADFERDVIFYYSHFDGENILTGITKPAGVVKSLTIPEGITIINEYILEPFGYADMIVLPDSLKTVGYFYSCCMAKLSVSEYTDLSALKIDKSRTEVTVRENKNMASLNLSEIWNSLTSENEYSYTEDGVTFKFSVPGGSFTTEIGEKGNNDNGTKYVWFTNSGLRVDVSFVDPEDERHAIYLGICGNNSSGSINDGVSVYAYYFDKEEEQFKKVSTRYYQFDVDYNEFSWVDNTIEDDYGTGDWYFELQNIVDYGYKVSDIVIKFAQSYNADLSER